MKFSLVNLLLVGVILTGVSLSGCGVRQPLPPSDYTAPQLFRHEVRFSGETLGIISAWYTGKSGNWKRVIEANPGMKPERIRIGDVVQIPEKILVRRESLPQSFVAKLSVAETQSDQEVPADLKKESAAVEEVGEKTETEIAPDSESLVEEVEGNAAEASQSVGGGSQEAKDAGKEASALTENTPDKDEATAPTPRSQEELERERLLDELLNQ